VDRILLYHCCRARTNWRVSAAGVSTTRRTPEDPREANRESPCAAGAYTPLLARCRCVRPRVLLAGAESIIARFFGTERYLLLLTLM